MSDHVRRQLLFEVGEHLFAADARDVVEVLEPMEATPVPGAVTGVRGLINLRGRLLVAGDFAVLLGLSSVSGEERALVVFEQGEKQLALEVERLVGMPALPAGELDVEEELLEALNAREVVKGVGRLGSRPYLQLDMGALFARVLEDEGDGGRAVQIGVKEGQERR